MVRKDTKDVFRKLELLVDKMKNEDVFHKKVVRKEENIIKKAAKKKKLLKKKSSKKPNAKAPQKNVHEVLGLKKIQPYSKIKLKSKPFVAIVERNKMQKTRAKIENIVIKDEAEKIKKSNDVKKINIKRIVQKEKTIHNVPIEPISTKSVVSIDENEKISKAIDLMIKHNIRGLAVTAGRELKSAVESEDLAKTIEDTGEQHMAALMETPVKEISRSAHTIEKNGTLGTAIQKMDETRSNRLFVVENKQPVGVVSKSDVFKKVVGSSSLGATIETGIDKLLELIEQHGKISVDEAAKILKVDIKLVEDWASILDDHSLIKLEYPIIGTIEMIKK